MPLLEDIKKTTEHLTGWHRPDPGQLDKLVRKSKATTYTFKDDGFIPNNPRWPVIIYRRAVRFPGDLDPAAVIEDIFRRNGWQDSWRDSIYDYLHYHSRIHEVRAAALRCGSAAAKAELLKSQRATSLFFRLGRDTSCSRPTKILSSSARLSPERHLRRMSAGSQGTCGRREACACRAKTLSSGTTGALFKSWKPLR